MAVTLPFLEQRRTAVLFAKVSSQRVLKAAAESHGRPRFFFPPTIEVAVAIAARASKVLADLRIAINHLRSFRYRPQLWTHKKLFPIRLPARTHRDFDRYYRSWSHVKYESRR